jgi:hypothetical protein
VNPKSPPFTRREIESRGKMGITDPSIKKYKKGEILEKLFISLKIKDF